MNSSLPVLEIQEVYSASEPVFDTIHTFTVVVENTGLVDAQMVTLNTTIRGTDVHSNATHDVPAGEEVTFIIDVDLRGLGPSQQWFDFEISPEGQEFIEQPEEVNKRYTLKAPPVEDTTPTTVIGLVLIVLLSLVLWYFTKSGSRRPGAPF